MDRIKGQVDVKDNDMLGNLVCMHLIYKSLWTKHLFSVLLVERGCKDMLFDFIKSTEKIKNMITSSY